jgi:hypothetical protein
MDQFDPDQYGLGGFDETASLPFIFPATDWDQSDETWDGYSDDPYASQLGLDEYGLGYADSWSGDYGYDNFGNDSVNGYWDNSPYDSFDDFSYDPYNFDEYGLGYPDTWGDDGYSDPFDDLFGDPESANEDGMDASDESEDADDDDQSEEEQESEEDDGEDLPELELEPSDPSDTSTPIGTGPQPEAWPGEGPTGPGNDIPTPTPQDRYNEGHKWAQGLILNGEPLPNPQDVDPNDPFWQGFAKGCADLRDLAVTVSTTVQAWADAINDMMPWIQVAAPMVDTTGLQRATPDTLNEMQQANLERFQNKWSGRYDTQIYDLPNGGKLFRTEVPGNTPGWSKIYDKVVDGAGNTIGFGKYTVDPQGNYTKLYFKAIGK